MEDDDKPVGGLGTEAQMASQINGGGCLPPPTPREQPKTLMQVLAKVTSQRDHDELLATQRRNNPIYQTSTQRMMRGGLGEADLDSKCDVSWVPEAPEEV